MMMEWRRFKRHLFHAKQNAGSIKKELLRLAGSATQHVSWDVISYVRLSACVHHPTVSQRRSFDHD
jgi:hypothetical protein